MFRLVKMYLICLILISTYEMYSSSVTISFISERKPETIWVYYNLENFASSFIKTPVYIEAEKTTFDFNIKNVCGITFYIKELKMDIPIYLLEEEELEVKIDFDSKRIEFIGERHNLHALFLERNELYQFKTLSDLIHCENKFLDKEYLQCLENWISEELAIINNTLLYDYYHDHFALTFLVKIKSEFNNSLLLSEFINHYLNKYISNPGNIFCNLLNYGYFYYSSKYAPPPSDVFVSYDLKSYNFLLNIKDYKVLSFMLQTQLLTMKEMKFPFIDFCGAYNEIKLLCDLDFGFPQFLSQQSSCED